MVSVALDFLLKLSEFVFIPLSDLLAQRTPTESQSVSEYQRLEMNKCLLILLNAYPCIDKCNVRSCRYHRSMLCLEFFCQEVSEDRRLVWHYTILISTYFTQEIMMCL